MKEYGPSSPFDWIDDWTEWQNIISFTSRWHSLANFNLSRFSSARRSTVYAVWGVNKCRMWLNFFLLFANPCKGGRIYCRTAWSVHENVGLTLRAMAPQLKCVSDSGHEKENQSAIVQSSKRQKLIKDFLANCRAHTVNTEHYCDWHNLRSVFVCLCVCCVCVCVRERVHRRLLPPFSCLSALRCDENIYFRYNTPREYSNLLHRGNGIQMSPRFSLRCRVLRRRGN